MSAIPILLTMLYLGPTAESPKSQAPASEASLKALQQRVETTHVSLSKGAERKARLLQKPAFRYSDELRQIEDAGVWLWTVQGRPVAAMKVERYQTGRFGIAGMTADGFRAKLNEEIVADIPHTAGRGNVFDNWTNFSPVK